MYTHTTGKGTHCQTSTHFGLSHNSDETCKSLKTSGRNRVKMAMSSQLQRTDGNPSTPFKIKALCRVYVGIHMHNNEIWYHFSLFIRAFVRVNIHMKYNESAEYYERCCCCRHRLRWRSRFYFTILYFRHCLGKIGKKHMSLLYVRRYSETLRLL